MSASGYPYSGLAGVPRRGRAVWLDGFPCVNIRRDIRRGTR